MSIVEVIMQMLRGARGVSPSNLPYEPPSEAKLKHLEFIQSVISRMSTSSFLFKGWAVTIAAGLAAFAAVESKRGLFVIALVPTMLFWALDGYYLWLERAFVGLYNEVRRLPNTQISFEMQIDKSRGFRRWLRTCSRWHLLVFYLSIMLVDVIGIILAKGN